MDALGSFTAIKIDESTTSSVPDISICYDQVPEVIIEITFSVTFNNEFDKLSRLVEKHELEEGFVYNYQKNAWRKCKFGVGEIIESPTFCETIGYDLNEFVK